MSALAKPLTALVTENQKAAHVVGFATVSTGMATYLEAIAPVVGVVASITGIIFTCVLIGASWRRDRREKKICDLELALLRKKLDGEGDSDG